MVLMAIRTAFEVLLHLSESSLGGKELGQTAPWSGTTDVLEGGGSWRQVIPASTTDLEVDLNGVAAGRLVAIKSNREITVKKNDSANEAWTVKPLGAGALEGIFVVTTDAVTSLYVSNAGTLDADVTFLVAGLA